MLNQPPGHLPPDHVDPQDFSDVTVELRQAVATCNMTDEDPGY